MNTYNNIGLEVISMIKSGHYWGREKPDSDNKRPVETGLTTCSWFIHLDEKEDVYEQETDLLKEIDDAQINHEKLVVLFKLSKLS